MRFTIVLSMVLLVGVLTVVAQNSGSQGTASSSNATLTGCLKGSKDQYYLVEKNGHRHTLMENGQDLSPYVDHTVTVSGKASTARKAGASTDAEGHRSGFFSVQSVTDQGTCKK